MAIASPPPARPERDDHSRLAGLLWVLVPIALYLFFLQRMWFDAPVWDDYDTILDSVLRLRDAKSAGEWLGIVVEQHNEHRIAVMRLTALATGLAFGSIDFRFLMFIGNLAVLGIFLLARAEYRDTITAPILGAAAFLMFQWSYYEATLMASAALPNIGVVFFSFACVYFASRGGRWSAAASVAFGALAAGSQANGLLALPLAALASANARKMPRAAALGAIAVAFWFLYFWSYSRPPNHPSMLAALQSPLATIQLFFVIIGGMAPGIYPSMLAGIAILAALAWLTRRGVWKQHPTAGFWVLFVLASAAAATLGRVGFGVFHASRYAVYSTCLLVIVLLSAFGATRPWGRRFTALAVAGCIAFSFAVSVFNRSLVADKTSRGRLLAEVSVPPGESAERFFGMQYPSFPRSARALARAEETGLYRPPLVTLHSPSIIAGAAAPMAGMTNGHLDKVVVSGSRVTIEGWTDITATLPGRTFTIYPPAGIQAARHVSFIARQDVALHFGDRDLLFSGFRIEVDYPSESEAREGAAALCAVVAAPDRPATWLNRPGVSCLPGTPR